MESQHTVLIIGGGLSGLTLAYLLKKKGMEATILEGAERLGGRIQTINGKRGTPLEMGATWFSEAHPRLLSLISELGLKKFIQYDKGASLFQTKSFEPAQSFFVPESQTPSYRLAGGTERLITALAARLSPSAVKHNTRVTAIREAGSKLEVETEAGDRYFSARVVCCLPPRLAGTQFRFFPALPDSVRKCLPEVQTWMAGAVKFAIEYETPFWRQMGYSGMLYSHSGIIVEMYDHTNFEENTFGLTGFLSSSAVDYPRQTRKTLALQQLTALMGNAIPDPVGYFDKVWNNAFVAAGHPVFQRPHQYNGHPVLKDAYMNGRLYFSGSETATVCPGYMEGAVAAARDLAESL